MLTKKEQQAWDLYNTHRNQTSAAKEMGISRRSFRRHFDAAKAKLNNTPLGFKTTKISTDGGGVVRAMTHKLAPEIDEVKRTGAVIKTSTLYGADGSVVGEWIMRKPEDHVVDDYVAALNKHFIDNVKPAKVPYVLQKSVRDDELALFMSIDEHVGVRCVFEQVGVTYGLPQAVEMMRDNFATLVARTSKTNTALYVNLGDQFHSNDHMDVTPASKHPLFSDSSFDNVADAVVDLNKWRIEYLMAHYPNLKIRGVAGNHDRDAMGWLFRCYKHMFGSHNLDVKFWSEGLGVEQFGNNMLGFAHGDFMKPNVMAGACADRFPDVYGQTRMRYLHTGHFHTDKANDTWGGFKHFCHRTIAPKDLYSFSHGYISRQSMKSFLYDIKEGEVASFTKTLI
jgi:hypothetical protein